MRRQETITCILCLAILFFSFNWCSSQNNIALGKAYSSSNFFPGFPPDNAFDNNTLTNWNAGGPAAQWISVDLLGTFDVYVIRLTVSQSPNGNTTHNIYKTSDNINWVLVESVSGVTSDQDVIIRDYSASPINTAGIRVETTLSPSWVAWYEIEVFDSNILPVEMMSFEGAKTREGVFLKWSTASELNNSGFEIQKSIDGRDWQKEKFVEGHGNTDEQNEYQFQDLNPFQGINYYRLKQIDFDGEFEYSKTIAIKFENQKEKLQIFPNPSNKIINIHFDIPSNQRMEIKIFDTLGRIVWENNLYESESNFRQKIEIERNGIYFVSAQVGNKLFSERVLITGKN